MTKKRLISLMKSYMRKYASMHDTKIKKQILAVMRACENEMDYSSESLYVESDLTLKRAKVK